MSNTDMIDLLLIEDDKRLAALTQEYLAKHNIVVSHESDGEKALRAALAHRYDIILLDLMLPSLSGIEICKSIRQRSDVPIIMITARGEEADRILGLELGADDYLPKPYSPRELLARVQAVVRRARGQVGPSTKTINLDDLELAPNAYSAKLNGQELMLTAYEFSLLYALADRAGRVLTREQLMDIAKGTAE